MLLIIAAPDVRDHLSDREVSTALFLPASIGSMVGELPRAHDISGQWISITIQENIKSSRNFKFREAVQFNRISKQFSDLISTDLLEISQIRRCKGFAVKYYGFTLCALTLEHSGFCNARVYSIRHFPPRYIKTHY